MQPRHASLADAIAAAEAQERDLREFSHLGLPYTVAGVGIRGMNLRDFIILTGIKSPLLTGGAVTPEDIILYLWSLSTEEETCRQLEQSTLGMLFPAYFKRRTAQAKKRFGKSLAKKILTLTPEGRVTLETVIQEIDNYQEMMFQDSPEGGKTARPVYSFVTGLIGYLSQDYGYSPEFITMPLPELYQHIRFIERRNNPTAFIGSTLSLKAAGDYLRSLEQKK